MKPLANTKLPYLLVGLLALGVAWWLIGRETTEPIPAFKDEAEARTYLGSQVADGHMTQVEAQLRLAESISTIKKRDRKADWQKAFAEKMKETMNERNVSEEEAKEMMTEDLKNRKGKSKAKSGAEKKKVDGNPETK